MEDEIKTWLSDIQQAIVEIELFLPKTAEFKEFQKDLKTKRAIERNQELLHLFKGFTGDFAQTLLYRSYLRYLWKDVRCFPRDKSLSYNIGYTYGINEQLINPFCG